MPTAIILVLVALGSVLFHILSPWWWTPIASNWGYIDNTIIITFWITGIAFTAILLFMAYCVFRFRHQPGRRAVYDPENKKLEWWLTIVTAVGVGAMLAPGMVVWNQFVTVPEGAIVSRHLSWEETAADLALALAHGAAFSTLKRCAHVVVPLGLEGVLLFSGSSDPTTARLWYVPDLIENDLRGQRGGDMSGFSCAFTAALAARIATTPPKDWPR